jgi:8-oxo-dGTP pyrophosphatase MutT (NUDIX family)
VKIEPGREPATPRDAATVVVLREEDRGFSVFMVKRHAKSAFMGGAYVFPGGKLDAEDSAPEIIAKTSGLSDAEAARALGEPDDVRRAIGLYVAAVRETFEEAGVLLARDVDTSALASARADLEGGAAFATVVDGLGATLDLTRLTPWTRWVTPVVEPRRYDARFFLARAPRGQLAAHDQRETTDGAWLPPGEALAREERGEIQLPPPTMRSLEMLASFDDIDAALADASSRTPPLVEPVFRDDDGKWSLLLPGAEGHPVPEARIPGPTRFVLAEGRWWSGEPHPKPQ